MKAARLAATVLTLALFPVANAVASEEAGEKIFKKQCSKCHTLEPGKHLVGPSLANIFGKQAGTSDFKRYKGLKDTDIVWDEENLHGWLENPKKFLGKKTSMNNKIKKAEDRDAVIEFLKTN
mgnify:CR=1 FL=1